MHFDNYFYDETAKNVPIWNLHNELRKSKCNSIIPGGITQNIPLWNVHCEPKIKSFIRQFHLVYMFNSSYRVSILKPQFQLKFQQRLKQNICMNTYFKLWSLSLNLVSHPSYTPNISIVITQYHLDSGNCHK